MEQIVGKDLVEGYGGKVCVTGSVEGFWPPSANASR